MVIGSYHRSALRILFDERVQRPHGGLVTQVGRRPRLVAGSNPVGAIRLGCVDIPADTRESPRSSLLRGICGEWSSGSSAAS